MDLSQMRVQPYICIVLLWYTEGLHKAEVQVRNPGLAPNKAHMVPMLSMCYL